MKREIEEEMNAMLNVEIDRIDREQTDLIQCCQGCILGTRILILPQAQGKKHACLSEVKRNISVCEFLQVVCIYNIYKS